MIKRRFITYTDQDVEKKEYLYTGGGDVNWHSHYGNSLVVPQKIKNGTNI